MKKLSKTNRKNKGKTISRRHTRMPSLSAQDDYGTLHIEMPPRVLRESSKASAPEAVLSLQSMVGNQAMKRLLAPPQFAADTAPSMLVQRDSDVSEPPAAIGYMGLNPKAYKESRALRRYSKDKVVISLDSPVNQKEFDTEEKRILFVYRKLNISPFDSAKFLYALACPEKCNADFREQMADMMQLFHRAEAGEYRLERLILSGHHSGGEMWGDSNDQHSPGAFLPETDLANLTKTFPQAAAQVKDVMFSACNSTELVELCKRIFPGLQSVWVYAGYSPRVDQGSAYHITRWERRTRGERQPVKQDKIGNSVIWTKDKGFLTKFD